ncbi:MAG: glycosyltransferase family 2 protein [Flavobacteriaceae bacterium]
MNAPKVSIITANYNCEKFIGQTIDSVINQKFRDWEFIIADDGSTDKSISIIQEKFKGLENVKLIKIKNNSGPANARNEALKEAQGKFISFIDSDDLWKAEFLQEMIHFMEKNKIAFAFSSYYRISEKGDKIDQYIVPEKVSYHSILKSCPICPLTAIYDTSITGKIPMPEIPLREDYGLFINLLNKTKFAYAVKKPLAFYRIREGSVSSNKFRIAKKQWEVYRKYERLSLIKSLYYFSNYIILSAFKYGRVFLHSYKLKQKS